MRNPQNSVNKNSGTTSSLNTHISITNIYIFSHFTRFWRPRQNEALMSSDVHSCCIDLPNRYSNIEYFSGNAWCLLHVDVTSSISFLPVYVWEAHVRKKCQKFLSLSVRNKTQTTCKGDNHEWLVQFLLSLVRAA